MRRGREGVIGGAYRAPVTPRRAWPWLAAAALCVAGTAGAFEILQPLPAHAPVPEAQPMSAARIDLGRRLFFEPRLSRSGALTCNHCHNVMAGGEDGRARAIGDSGRPTARSAPTLWNVAFQTVLYWDGRARSLEEAIGSHLLDADIMGLLGPGTVARRIGALPGYVEAFQAAFGAKAPVSDARAAEALSAYIRTLLTPDSPFDRYIRGDKGALSAAARRGLKHFDDIGCLSCHFGVNFAGPAPGPALGMGEGFYELFPNHLGTAYDARYGIADDLGRFLVTGEAIHRHMWRVPTLRNIAVTAPYFHNGAVPTLDEAVRVMALTQLKRTLGDDEVADIVAFLASLTGEFPAQPLPRLPLESGRPRAAAAQ